MAAKKKKTKSGKKQSYTPYIIGGTVLIAGLGGAYYLSRRSAGAGGAGGAGGPAPRLPMAKPFQSLSRQEVMQRTAAHQQQWREGGGLEGYCANNPNHPRCAGEYGGTLEDLWSAGTSLFDSAAKATNQAMRATVDAAEGAMRATVDAAEGAARVTVDAAEGAFDAALSPVKSYQQNREEEAQREKRLREKLKKKLQRSEAATRKANTRMWVGISILTIGVLSPLFIKKEKV